MSGRLYLGLDLGTTGVKAGVFDTRGAALAVTSREIGLANPAPGFVEFDGERYGDLAFNAVRELLAAPQVVAGQVCGIGLASQAQTFVLVGDDGRPLRPAISWLDVRAAAEAAEFSAVSQRELGAPTDAIASGPKLLWLLRHEPEAVSRARRVLLLPDYLTFRLTGRAITDVRTAESTACYSRPAERWVDALLALCGLRRELMPEVAWPGDAAGPLLPAVARELGFRQPPLVAVGAMDQLAGALGAGNVTPGCGSLALGTALALIVTAHGEPPVSAGVSLRPHAARGLSALLAYAKTSGVVIRWFRDHFAPAWSYEDFFREAAAAPIGCEGVTCCPHFSGMATPSFNPALRGAFGGLSLGATPRHFARAIVEALTFTVCGNIELIQQAGPHVQPLRAIGGGARADVWLQMIADATGVEVERPSVREAACFGAAQLAMVACGDFASVTEASRALYRAERIFTPDAALRPAYASARWNYDTALRLLTS